MNTNLKNLLAKLLLLGVMCAAGVAVTGIHEELNCKKIGGSGYCDGLFVTTTVENAPIGYGVFLFVALLLTKFHKVD